MEGAPGSQGPSFSPVAKRDLVEGAQSRAHLRQRQELAGGRGVQGADTLHHLQAGGCGDVQEVAAQGYLQALQQHLGCLGQVPLGQRHPPLRGEAQAQASSAGRARPGRGWGLGQGYLQIPAFPAVPLGGGPEGQQAAVGPLAVLVLLDALQTFAAAQLSAPLRNTHLQSARTSARTQCPPWPGVSVGPLGEGAVGAGPASC